MKKVLALVFSLVLVLSLAACGGEKSNIDDSSKSAYSSNNIYEKANSELSDQEINSKVAKALKSEVESIFSKAEPSFTKFSISKKEYSGDDILVYGTLTLYDKYGDLTYPYHQKFELRIGAGGSIGTNTIKFYD